MDPRERGERRRPVIHDIFPIGSEAAKEAVDKITSLARRRSFPDRLLRMAKNIGVENKEIVRLFFVQLGAYESYIKTVDLAMLADVWLGAVYAYEVFSKEAQARGGRLPKINLSELGTYMFDQIHPSAIGIELDAIPRHLDQKIEEMSLAEPNLMDGFNQLMGNLRVNEASARTAKGSAYQMYTIFKTHGEIQRIRQIAGIK